MNIALILAANFFVLAVVLAVIGWNCYARFSRDGRWAMLGAVAGAAAAALLWFVVGAVWWVLT